MATVLRWVDRHQGETALSVLGAGGPTSERAADLLAGILTTDDREQSGIWSTASGTLGAYRSAAALASTEPPFLDPDLFCDGANTLFVCAPGRYQQLLAPLVVGVLTDVRDADLPTGRRRPLHTAGAARPRRGGQHRAAARPAPDRQRGHRARPPAARLLAGSLPSPRPMGTAGRGLRVAVRHHRRPPWHRRPTDPRRALRVGRRRRDRHPHGRNGPKRRRPTAAVDQPVDHLAPSATRRHDRPRRRQVPRWRSTRPTGSAGSA